MFRGGRRQEIAERSLCHPMLVLNDKKAQILHGKGTKRRRLVLTSKICGHGMYFVPGGDSNRGK